MARKMGKPKKEAKKPKKGGFLNNFKKGLKNADKKMKKSDPFVRS